MKLVVFFFALINIESLGDASPPEQVSHRSLWSTDNHIYIENMHFDDQDTQKPTYKLGQAK